MSETYIAHVDFQGTEKRRWVLFNEERHIKSQRGESLRTIQMRWIKDYGAPTKWFRYKGIMRPSEVAATMADLRMPFAEEAQRLRR